MKTSRIEILPQSKQDKKITESWNRSIGVMSRKPLMNLVKRKSNVTQIKVDAVKTIDTKSVNTNTPEKEKSDVKEKEVSVATGLSLLADYSGSDSDS